MKLVKLVNCDEFTMVDDEDAEYIASLRPYMRPDGYVVVRANGKNIRLNRFLMNVTDPNIVVDHKDRQPLNNCKDNLRPCSRSRNLANAKKRIDGITSKYKGVHWNNQKGRWSAAIQCQGKTTRLGYFDAEDDAAKAYDKAAIEFFGEFATLNFIDFDYSDYIPNKRFWDFKEKSSKYHGVYWVTKLRKWISAFNYKYKKYHVGTFDNERDAAIAYNKKVLEVVGPEAIINVIEDEDESSRDGVCGICWHGNGPSTS